MRTHPEVKILDRTHISQQDTEVKARSLILVYLAATDDAVATSNRRQATDTLDHRKVTPTAVTRRREGVTTLTLTLKTDTHYTIYQAVYHENGHSQRQATTKTITSTAITTTTSTTGVSVLGVRRQFAKRCK